MYSEILAKSSMVQRKLKRQFTTKCTYLVERLLYEVPGNTFEKNKIVRKKFKMCDKLECLILHTEIELLYRRKSPCCV